jgi:cyclic pyranopterin phosphate synthase
MMIESVHYRHLNVPAGDLRLSIVANCNMRCVYCHNEGQGAFRPRAMSVAQVRHIVERARGFGVYKVRLTGGEPTLHPQFAEICTMLKRELRVPNVGVNTNGIDVGVLLPLHHHGVLDQIVVGLDYFDSEVSKQSPIGQSSEAILGNVLTLRQQGANVQIATVFDGDINNIVQLARWCLAHDVLFKVLEISDTAVASDTSPEFTAMRERVMEEYGLHLGITADLNELFGADSTGRTRILFFHSHCRVRECSQCANMHMRVTADGRAKPCILRSDTEMDLLHGDFDLNFRRAIANLGVPPEKPAR